MEISHIILRTLNPSNSSDPFIAYLDRPVWFKERFQAAFDAHRLEMNGTIFLACNSTNPEEMGGCVYVVPKSTHLSFGKPIPIFGWLQADNPETSAFLLNAAEDLVREQGYHALRGPINEPHLYGGWGAAIEKDPSFPVMVDAPENPLELGSWIEASGYEISATYLGLDTKTVHYPSILFRNNQFRFISPTWDELVADPALLKKVKAHVKRNFAYYLPDHNAGTFEKAFDIFSQVKNGNDFYLFMQDTTTEDIVGLIWFIPNVFQQWQGEPITILDVNGMMIDKAYRKKKAIYLIYREIQKKMKVQGIQRQIGVSVWDQNKIAKAVFLKHSTIIGKFVVYQKDFDY